MYQTPYGSMLRWKTFWSGGLRITPSCLSNCRTRRTGWDSTGAPAGVYLRAFCIGNWDRLPARYEAILRYAEQHHLQFSGYAYEIGINELVIDRIEDYITKIEIPVLNFN